MRLVPDLSRAPANAHLGTQSAEAPRNVPLQNQGPLDLRRPEVGLPPVPGDYASFTCPNPSPTPQRESLERSPAGGPQNSLSGRENLQLLEL